jgi:hypothetical protein
LRSEKNGRHGKRVLAPVAFIVERLRRAPHQLLAGA